MTRIKELDLTKNYSFYVAVEYHGNNVAGELHLSPDACSLTIRADVLQDRSPDFPFDNIEELVCSSFDGTFFLYGLKPISSNKRILQHYPVSIGHFESKYSVSHVIFTSGSLSTQVKVQAIKLDSCSIAKWVGCTTTQDSIVSRHIEANLFSSAEPIPDEFEQYLDNQEKLCVVYEPRMHHSTETFSIGLKFSPLLLHIFNVQKSGIEAIESFLKIETIFKFITGNSLNIQKITLISNSRFSSVYSLYTSRGHLSDLGDDYALFPLGKNLRINYMELPEFPLPAISKYFDLMAEEQRYFEKYLKYRKMSNPEEQFLGFFRLLEKLCFQKDFYFDEDKLNKLLGRVKPFLVRHFNDSKNVNGFLRKIPRLNSSKLNTASCLQKFIKQLPTELLDRWIYKLSDIESICKLRNDLTHANEFEPVEFEIERKAKFIETLLTIALFNKIGVSTDIGALIVPRIKGHDIICRSIEPYST